MRKKALDMVHDLARRDARVVFIGSDLGCGTLEALQKELPGQFLMEGINEACAVGMAAGMAMEGRVVYVNTIATFLARRALEQVCVDLCMHKLPVRLIANGGGLVYAPLGSTHLAVEDLALMRALPNMTVVAPCDAPEMERCMAQTLDWPGPMYIRLAKGYDPVVSDPAAGFAIGRAIHCRKGSDVLLAVTGVALQQALGAADLLAAQGVSAGVLHMHTLKPFDAQALLEAAAGARAVVTVEEHTLLGGLGSAAAETLLEAGMARPFKRLGIPDIFPDYYGTQLEIMARLGLDAQGVARAALELLEAPRT
ncbi:1-deoxy-D-xylulose-5-phosphate synthase [Fundidesulfovibrio magnetotacticus]|uniref:1-deoxy-D-xylulose-5-phosphate synthase n=1 Tax=Fundidesulfovibrio magnetotacticus TaxID=2730080 RepID=A0A6V8M3B7_9BACT|nr:transketolase C-terminal domain-containing protein [Fundidesulfovibrio magnetotacticus]GFK94955.1 1-deoxy-D-xylulose-5-phosphate synthase [Fundidesulfovibrio magnetotacticus]